MNVRVKHLENICIEILIIYELYKCFFMAASFVCQNSLAEFLYLLENVDIKKLRNLLQTQPPLTRQKIKTTFMLSAAYTVVQFSSDVNKDGGYLLLRCTVRQCVNRETILRYATKF